jgi:Tol biopolymer transport system component
VTAAQERVSAAIGDRYSIERELGRGGMATVYLAEDLRHHRKVAIKVLKDDVSASVGAARFLREIEIAAQLQHPHILPLLDSGQSGGVLFYVMPWVEGQSLRQRLAREGELPVADALRILVEVADALAYAHSRGVVHRDIKPDNIMLTGRHAVVADFGVARAVSEAVDSSTLTSLGVALGTPAYMAPEQAVADPHVDQRADIYALGIVAYELLAGRTPFAGGTAQQMLAAHVTERPDTLSRHRPGLAPVLEQAIMRCLEKRAADRFQTADELLALLEPLATPSGGTAPTEARLPAEPARVRSSRMPWIALAAVLVAVAAFGGWQLTRSAPATLELGRAIHVTTDPGLEIQPDISPDGRLVAYAVGNFARMRIYIRPVAGGRTIPLSDDSATVEFAPRWSPDGTQLLFLVRGGVSVAPALGGTSRPVVPPSRTVGVRSAQWSADGARIFFVRDDSLLTMPLAGGAESLIGSAPDLHSCAPAPSGAWIACVSQNSVAELPGYNFGNLAPSAILLFPAGGGSPRTIAEATSSNRSPAWSADGRLLYFLSNRDGPRDIYALDIAGTGAPRGGVQRLTTGLGAISLSVSSGGDRLAYAAYDARANLWSLPLPARGPVSAYDATPLTSGSQVVEAMRASPDGRWVIYDSNLGGRSHIWRVPVAGGTPEQLTNGPADEFAGDLSPDGRELAYHSWRSGTRDIEILPLAGGEPVRVTDTRAQESYPVWSADGSSILFVDQVRPDSSYVTTRGPGGEWSAPRRIAAPASFPAWSPDNSAIVFGDRHSPPLGRILTARVHDGEPVEIYRPGPGDPIAVRAVWGRDGRIYFKAHDRTGRASLWVIASSGGRPQQLVRFDDLTRPSSRIDFDVDRERFYFAIEDRESDVYVVEVTRR